MQEVKHLAMNDRESDDTSRLDEIIADYLSHSVAGDTAGDTSKRAALIADHPELAVELSDQNALASL